MNQLLYLRFRLKNPISLGMIFLFIHVGAIFCVYFIPIFWMFKAMLIFCVLVNLVVVMKTYVFRNSASAIIEFSPSVGVDGSWSLKKHAGDVVTGFIDYPVFVSNYLVVVNFILAGKGLKISLPISRDSLSADDFRKLKVMLKMTKHAEKLGMIT